MRGHEVLHELDSFRFIEDFYRYAAAAQQGFYALKGAVFADNDPWYFIE